MTNETGSSAARRVTSSGPGATKSSVAKVRTDLEKAANGLSQTSESDYPYRFFTLPVLDDDDLTIDGFLRSLGLSQQFVDDISLPVDKLIEERKLEDFFPTIEDLAAYQGTDTKDPEVIALSKRYRKLESVLRKHLGEVKVFRVGSISIRCFIVGRDKNGDFAGLQTSVVET